MILTPSWCNSTVCAAGMATTARLLLSCPAWDPGTLAKAAERGTFCPGWLWWLRCFLVLNSDRPVRSVTDPCFKATFRKVKH